MNAYIHKNLSNPNVFDIWICNENKPKQATIITIASSCLEDAYGVAKQYNAQVITAITVNIDL